MVYAGTGLFLLAGQGNGNGQVKDDRQHGNANGRDNGQGNASGDGNAQGNAGDRGNGHQEGISGEAQTYVAETVAPAYTLPVRQWVEYEYDAAGNRVRETSNLGQTDYSYDAANRLDQAGEVSFAYDAAGRLTRRSAPDGDVAFVYIAFRG